MTVPPCHIEVWKTIPGFGGHYEASSLGRIRSLDRIIKKVHSTSRELTDFFYTGKVLKQQHNKGGYLSVHIGVDKIKTSLRVSRAVLLAFKGLPPTINHFSCHNNSDPTNNCLYNLRWGTQKDNMSDRLALGNYKSGSKHHWAKLTESQVLEIRRGHKTKTQLSQEYGVSYSAIWDVINGRSWRKF